MSPLGAEILHQYWIPRRIPRRSGTGASLARATTSPEFGFGGVFRVKRVIYRGNMASHFRGHGLPRPLLPLRPSHHPFQPLPTTAIDPSSAPAARPRLSPPETPPSTPILTWPLLDRPGRLAPIPSSLGRSPATDPSCRRHPARRRVRGAVPAGGAGGRGQLIAGRPFFSLIYVSSHPPEGVQWRLQLPQRPRTRDFAMQQSNSVGWNRFPAGEEGGDRLFFSQSPIFTSPAGAGRRQFSTFSQLTNNWRLPSAQLDWRTFRNGLSVGNETSIGSGGLQWQSFRQLASVSVDVLRLPSGVGEGTLPHLRKPNIAKTHPKSIKRGRRTVQSSEGRRRTV